MEVALIPPVSLVEETQRTRMQLMLPHMLQNEAYKNQYLKYLEDNSHYVILDNGAAEDYLADDDDLVHLAMWYKPDELAIPDVLGECQLTIDAGNRFLSTYGMSLKAQRIKLGYVAQGADPQEALEGVRNMVFHWGWALSTIFLPRLLVKSSDTSARLWLAHRVHEEFPNYNIHLFGASPYWPGEVMYAKTYSYIRSIDTSLPYSYSFYGRKIKTRASVPISRPAEYFEKPATEFTNVDKNVMRYLEWTR